LADLGDTAGGGIAEPKHDAVAQREDRASIVAGEQTVDLALSENPLGQAPAHLGLAHGLARVEADIADVVGKGKQALDGSQLPCPGGPGEWLARLLAEPIFEFDRVALQVVELNSLQRDAV